MYIIYNVGYIYCYKINKSTQHTYLLRLVPAVSVVVRPRPKHVGVVAICILWDARDCHLFGQFYKVVSTLDDVHSFRDRSHGKRPAGPEGVLLLDRANSSMRPPVDRRFVCGSVQLFIRERKKLHGLLFKRGEKGAKR